MGNHANHAAFTPKMSIGLSGPLTGPSGTTTEATSHAGHQVEFSVKHYFIDIFGNFKQDFFLDLATRFLFNLPIVSGTMWVHII